MPAFIENYRFLQLGSSNTRSSTDSVHGAAAKSLSKRFNSNNFDSIWFCCKKKKKFLKWNCGIVNLCLEIAQWLMNGIWDGWDGTFNCGWWIAVDGRYICVSFVLLLLLLRVTVHVTGYNDGKCGHFASQRRARTHNIFASQLIREQTQNRNCAYTISKRSQHSARTQFTVVNSLSPTAARCVRCVRAFRWFLGKRKNVIRFKA